MGRKERGRGEGSQRHRWTEVSNPKLLDKQGTDSLESRETRERQNHISEAHTAKYEKNGIVQCLAFDETFFKSLCMYA